MRNLQSNIVPLVLVAAIVWGLTVAPVKHNVTGANKNFEYVVNGDDPLNPKNYLKISYTPICDTPKVYVCYIIAEENPASTGHPIIPLSLMNEIRTAVNNRTESEHVKLKP